MNCQASLDTTELQAKMSVGQLAELDSYTPCLYLDFPDGRAKLRGYRQNVQSNIVSVPSLLFSFSRFACRLCPFPSTPRSDLPCHLLQSSRHPQTRYLQHPASDTHAMLWENRAFEPKPSGLQVVHQFDHLIVFSELIWIGTAEDNPKEKPLPFPASLLKATAAKADLVEAEAASAEPERLSGDESDARAGAAAAEEAEEPGRR